MVFVGRNDEKRAVVMPLLADPPVPAEPIAEIFDGIALQRFERNDDDLIAGLPLMLGQHLRQPVLCGGREDVGFIDHAPCQRWECRRGGNPAG